jgi:HD-GYP domain-containing protein (c-di-GMP phosphodiesterase class II)
VSGMPTNPPKPRVRSRSYSQLDFCHGIQELLLRLQASRQASHATTITLETIRQGLDADCVYWCPRNLDGHVVSVGPVGLTPKYCVQFLSKRLAEHEGTSELVWSHSLDIPRDSPMQPFHAVLVCFGNCPTRSPWVVAVGFHPESTFQEADLQFLCLVRDVYLNHRQANKAHVRLKESLVDLVRCLTTTIDARDPLTRNHSERVASIAMVLGRQMHLSDKVNGDLYLAGLLHDVGKIGIRDDVLFKDGKLTAEEYAHIQEHTVIGDAIVGKIKQFEHLREGVRNHHERYDGTGYPDRLSGEKIPLLARILALADSYDAMRSSRRYRKGMETAQVEKIIEESAGAQFDPAVVEHFLAYRHTILDSTSYEKGVGETAAYAVWQLVEAIKDGSSTLHPLMKGSPAG